jgi:hypothetical protein
MQCLAGDARVHDIDARAGHSFGVLHRFLDRAHRFIDVGDDATAESRRAGLAHTENIHGRMLRKIPNDFRDDGGGLGRSDVEPSNEAFYIHGSLAMT